VSVPPRYAGRLGGVRGCLGSSPLAGRSGGDVEHTYPLNMATTLDRHSFPFTAIVGQESMKLALILNAIEPAVGGVLIRGAKRTEPGVLAEANRNILYVDEVNLLDDHIVDVLLDAAAMGVNVIEREGVSFLHPSRFILIGTMNPEEGELRPQLLDRFGLCVDVEGIRDPDERVLIAERDAAFKRGDHEFMNRSEEHTSELQ